MYLNSVTSTLSLTSTNELSAGIFLINRQLLKWPTDTPKACERTESQLSLLQVERRLGGRSLRTWCLLHSWVEVGAHCESQLNEFLFGVCQTRQAVTDHLYLTKPIWAAFSLKACLQSMMSYLRIRPRLRPVILQARPSLQFLRGCDLSW